MFVPQNITYFVCSTESNPNAHCAVTSPLRDGHDVNAYQRLVMTSSLGCESQEVTSRGEEVHVFNVKGGKIQEDAILDLRLRQRTGEEGKLTAPSGGQFRTINLTLNVPEKTWAPKNDAWLSKLRSGI